MSSFVQSQESHSGIWKACPATPVRVATVTALVEGVDHVCCRYRVEPFGWALAERGFQLEIVPIAENTAARLSQFFRARRSHVVLLQRKLLPVWQLTVLRKCAARLVYDFDDALFQRDSYSPKGPDSRARLGRFWATVQAADAIIAGNDYLAERAASYVDAARVSVVPTCVEPGLYQSARHERTGAAARLAWIGQRSTLPSLKRFEPQLKAASNMLDGLKLRLIADETMRLDGVDVVFRRWAEATEAKELAAADIGISVLPDDSWSLGKCGLKVLQYMAAGLPVVGNPVGMNRRMIEHGRTGFLASTPNEWAKAIRKLANDPGLRRIMGGEGRRFVEREYSVGRWKNRFAEILSNLAGS